MTGSILRRLTSRLCVGLILAVTAVAHADPKITIWNLGDSVTDGAGSEKTGETDSGGLRKSMINELIKAGYDPVLYGSVKTEHPERIPEVMNNPARWYHEGHNGFTIGGLISGVESWLKKSPSNNDQPIRPQFVTVMIGTNDVGQAYFKAKDAKKQMDEAAIVRQMGGDLRTLVTKIVTARPDAHVIVSSIIPGFWAYGIDDKATGRPYPGVKAPKDKTDYMNNHYVIAYNTYIKTKLVPEFQRAGKKVTFVDIYPDFIGTDKDGNTVILTDLFGDTTHPNTKGYDRIGASFAQAILDIAKKGK